MITIVNNDSMDYNVSVDGQAPQLVQSPNSCGVFTDCGSSIQVTITTSCLFTSADKTFYLNLGNLSRYNIQKVSIVESLDATQMCVADMTSGKTCYPAGHNNFYAQTYGTIFLADPNAAYMASGTTIPISSKYSLWATNGPLPTTTGKGTPINPDKFNWSKLFIILSLAIILIIIIGIDLILYTRMNSSSIHK